MGTYRLMGRAGRADEVLGGEVVWYIHRDEGRADQRRECIVGRGERAHGHVETSFAVREGR